MISDTWAEEMCKAVSDGKIVSFAMVVVEHDGTINRCCSCDKKDSAAELLGAVALLQKGTYDYYNRWRPETLTPVANQPIPKPPMVTILGY